MKKRGQFDISFSMIFSIIVIIAIVGVAFYVIRSFVFVSNCAEIGLFYDDLKNYIDEAWQSTIHQDTFPNKKHQAIIPSGIELVCFGNLTQSPSKDYKEQYDSLLRSNINAKDRNVFLYPEQKSCDSSLKSYKLNHIKTQEFFCLQVKDNKISLKTKKDEFESSVTISS